MLYLCCEVDMDLIKDNWTRKDVDEFQKWEFTLKSDEFNCEWEKKIVNTNLVCFARTSAKAKDVVKQIKKGNFCGFLDLIQIKTHFDSLVCVYLINTIKDFEMHEKYLDKFILTIDNWASVDTLKFDKLDKDRLVDLSKKYLKNKLTFVRRVGVKICFELIKTPIYLGYAFEVLDSLETETEYYVNMCAAWLLAECVTKYYEQTIGYLEKHKTNDFIVNKGIQKCRDSYRISQEKRDELLKFKKVKNAKLCKKS